MKELQAKIVKTARDYGVRHNIVLDSDYIMLKLQEELGELTQAYLIYRRKCRIQKYRLEAEAKAEVANELADVAGFIFFLAEVLEIDLEAALVSKWINKKQERPAPARNE